MHLIQPPQMRDVLVKSGENDDTLRSAEELLKVTTTKKQQQ